MADPYEGLSAEQWKKALQEVRAQIPGMRQEAAALNKELTSGRKTIKDIEAAGRRGATIGAGARPADPATAAREAEKQVAATERVARAEAQIAAARQRSLDVLRKISIINRTGPFGVASSAQATARMAAEMRNLSTYYSRLGGYGGGGFAGGGGIGGGPFSQRQLPPGPPPRLALPAGPPPPLALPAPGQTVGGQEYANRMRQINAETAKATIGTGAFSSNLQRNQAVLAASSREMRKFGALTTEFISAAGRGAVTVRELGFQVTSTIGKFGGWLGAGAAVYGAFAAISAVGRGAIDTQSGINQLNRVVANVNADDAAEQFRDLAGSFNLPIEDVSNAAFEMGKVFDNQNDALEATKAVLASVKVGELDVATSSRYLTSIIQAFKLPASEMAGVFDQVNQAQNTFGIRIEDTLAGLAKASGTFKAAGGDISSLLAIITTARRATGQTGEVIGTALARAPNFLRQTSNRQVLAAFGIDATDTITDVISQAFDKAQGLSGERLQELAAAIFGPQYGARVGTPLLQQADLYQKVLRDTSAEASKGSAQKELQSVLAQTDEQLRKVIVQLEVMGSALAEAGAFDAFGLLLGTLNTTLVTVNNLLDIFNELPSPIRRAVTYMAQFVALIALARRLNVGQSFTGAGQVGAAGRALFTRRDQQGFLYREGLTGQRDVLAREAEGSAQAAVRRSIDVEAARATVAQEQAAASRLVAQRKAGAVIAEEATLEQQSRIVAAETQLGAAREAELAAMTRNQAILREALLVESQLVALKNGANAAQLARAYGVVIPQTVGAGVGRAGALAGISRPENVPPSLLQEPGTTSALLRQIGLAQAGPQQVSGVRKVTGAIAQNMRQYGVMGGVLATGGQAVKTATNAATQRLSRISLSTIGGAARGFGTKLAAFGRSLASFIGPLDAVLIGAFILVDGISKALNQVDEAQDAIDAVPTDLAGFQQQQADLMAKAEEGYSAIGAVLGVGGAVEDAREELEARSAQRNRELQNLIAGRQSRNTSYLYEEDFKNQIGVMVDAFKSGTDDGVALGRRARNLITTIRDAVNLTDEQQNRLVTQVRVARVEARGTRSGYEALAAIAGPDGELVQSISDYGDAVSSGLGSLKQRGELIQEVLVQAAENMRSNKPEDRAAAADALDAVASALTDAAQAELDRSLTFARGQDQRNAAYDEYLAATSPRIIRRQSQALIRQQQNRLEQNQRISRQLAQDAARENRRGALGGLASGLGAAALRSLGFGGLANIAGLEQARQAANLAPIVDELEKRGLTQKEIKERIQEIRRAQKEAIERIKAIRQQVRDERFQEQSDLIQARSEIAVGRADEGLPALRIALTTIGRLIERAIRRYGRDSKEVLDLIAERQSARDSIIEEQMSLIQADADYAAAGFAGEGQEQARQQAEIDGLYRQLAFMQAHSRQYSAGDVRGLQAQIREAEAALAQQAEDDAEALRDALYDVQIARAEARGNEVAAARRTLNKALYDLRSADTPEERATGRADVIRQRAALRDSIFQRQLEDIQFQSDIGNLTLQQQIRAYQQLLRTAEITRDQRRDLRRRIFQLKEEAEQATGDFDLRVGDIKLPTTYEIRRAIQGGLSQGANVAMSQQNNYYVQGSNADEIVNKVARKQEDAARRNRNMARSAGIT